MDLEKIKQFNEAKHLAAEKAKEAARQTQDSKTVERAVHTTTKALVGTTAKLAKSTDIEEVIKQLKETQLAAYLGGNKSSVILADSTDLGDRVAELGAKITEAIDSIRSDKSQAKAFNALADNYKSLVTAVTDTAKNNNATLAAAVDNFTSSLDAKDFSPNISVKAPNVNVAPPDLSPLNKTLDKLLAVPKTRPEAAIHFDDYKAQDLASDGEAFQYVGFVNPKGAWYIIFNDIDNNSLRYKFGVKNYTGAWKSRSGMAYLLLNEALNEIQA